MSSISSFQKIKKIPEFQNLEKKVSPGDNLNLIQKDIIEKMRDFCNPKNKVNSQFKLLSLLEEERSENKFKKMDDNESKNSIVFPVCPFFNNQNPSRLMKNRSRKNSSVENFN